MAKVNESDLAMVIGVLWGEIPLASERSVLDRLHREGLYETWETALDMNMVQG